MTELKGIPVDTTINTEKEHDEDEQPSEENCETDTDIGSED